jgi:hypothetical protein
MRVIIAATMFAAALASSSAVAQTMGKRDMGKSAYCLNTSAGAINCAYKTMADCEKAKTGSDTCMKNSGGDKMSK